MFRKPELNNVAAILLQLLHVLLSPPLQGAVIFWDLFYLPKSEIWTAPYHVDTQTGVHHLKPPVGRYDPPGVGRRGVVSAPIGCILRFL